MPLRQAIRAGIMKGTFRLRIKAERTEDVGCGHLPIAPVQKRLRTFSAQFHDFRPVRAQIATA